MQKLAEILAKAEARGIRFRVEGERLKADFPEGEKTERVVQWIQANREGIIRELTSVRRFCKNMKLERYDDLITKAARGELSGQDVFVTLWEPTRNSQLRQTANLTNFVLYQVKRFGQGKRYTAIFKLELARRAIEKGTQ